jgi:hypothetical protein
MTGKTKSSGAQQAQLRPQCIRAAKPWLRPLKEEKDITLPKHSQGGTEEDKITQT